MQKPLTHRTGTRAFCVTYCWGRKPNYSNNITRQPFLLSYLSMCYTRARSKVGLLMVMTDDMTKPERQMRITMISVHGSIVLHL